jgi:hypothetical protein
MCCLSIFVNKNEKRRRSYFSPKSTLNFRSTCESCWKIKEPKQLWFLKIRSTKYNNTLWTNAGKWRRWPQNLLTSLKRTSRNPYRPKGLFGESNAGVRVGLPQTNMRNQITPVAWSKIKSRSRKSSRRDLYFPGGMVRGNLFGIPTRLPGMVGASDACPFLYLPLIIERNIFTCTEGSGCCFHFLFVKNTCSLALEFPVWVCFLFS